MIAVKLQGRNCNQSFDEIMELACPYTGTLGHVDIVNGGCGPIATNPCMCGVLDLTDNHFLINTRCKQSQSDSVFMFIIVILGFATMALAYLRTKKSL
jgi:hypothetical protein